MHDLARLRSELRPHGVVSAGCRTCYLLETCGGIEPERSLLSCFDLTCCGQGQDCKRVCLYNPDFMRRLEEVGGFRFNGLKPVPQVRTDLPQYVPVVDHNQGRFDALNYPVVALSTYRVIRVKRQEVSTMPRPSLFVPLSGSQEPRIILRGTARDPLLERLWQYGERDDAAGQLAALGVSLIVAPNFSHVLNVPRTEHLYNRKRQILCIEQMVEAGLNVAPHLSAVTPGDWAFWHRYWPTMHRSFTSPRSLDRQQDPDAGRKTIDSLASLQRDCGRAARRTHRSTQFIEYVAGRFESFTLINSEPFARTTRR